MRMKPDELNSNLLEYHQVNTLPTYDNMLIVYMDLRLPYVNQIYLTHKKEQMIFMIINMVRTQPQLYLHALGILQDRCSQRQNPHNLAFRYEDVQYAIELLKTMEPREPLLLSDDLCVYSKNLANKSSEQLIPLKRSAQNEVQSYSPRSKKIELKSQQKTLISSYKKVKQMTIDYYCREDLTVTTLKEFFEIFISSLKKDQAFHQELISDLYQEIGLSMKFDQNNTQATLTIFLGGVLT